MSERSRAPGATDLLLVLMATIWGINYTAVKYAGVAFGPLTFTSLRVAGAALTLAAIVAIQRKPRASRRDVLSLLALGVVGNGVYQILFVEGVSRTRVANAALIVAASPAMVALISQLRGIEDVRPRSYAGIALSIAGVGVVMLGATTGTATHTSAVGVVIMIVAVVFFSVFTVAVQPFTQRIDPTQVNSLAMAGGALGLILVLPWTISEQVHSTHAAPGAAAWIALAYASIGSLGIAYIFWLRGIRVLGPTRTAIYGNLQPIVAILFGWAALAEAPTMAQLAGTALIISGIVLTRI